MAAYLNQGGLWDNQRKYEPHDPDFVGSINIAGVEHKIVAWMSTSTNKLAPTINIKLSDTRPVPMPEHRPVAVDKEKEDDIPF
jgi:hypothetical protein